VRYLLTAPRSLSEYEIQNDQSELAMVSGGMMCISAEVLADGMDTLLPMYLEDQEICMRSLAKDRAVRLYPDLELLHIGGVSRKSVTRHELALRIMELVEAPVQCMSRLQGYNVMGMRLIVLLGGVSRFLAAPIMAAVKLVFRNGKIRAELTWMSDQQRLAAWFMIWAIKGDLHSQEVTLSEYFRQYSANE
jgi:GT2 family glycosyltransferase